MRILIHSKHVSLHSLSTLIIQSKTTQIRPASEYKTFLRLREISFSRKVKKRCFWKLFKEFLSFFFLFLRLRYFFSLKRLTFSAHELGIKFQNNIYKRNYLTSFRGNFSQLFFSQNFPQILFFLLFFFSFQRKRKLFLIPWTDIELDEMGSSVLFVKFPSSFQLLLIF